MDPARYNPSNPNALNAYASNSSTRTIKVPFHSADFKTIVAGEIIKATITQSMNLASLIILTAAHGPTCAIAAGIGAIAGASLAIGDFVYVKAYIMFDESNPPHFNTMVRKINYVAKKFFKGIAWGGYAVGLNFVCVKYIPVVGFPLAVFESCLDGFKSGTMVTGLTLQVLDGVRQNGYRAYITSIRWCYRSAKR